MELIFFEEVDFFFETNSHFEVPGSFKLRISQLSIPSAGTIPHLAEDGISTALVIIAQCLSTVITECSLLTAGHRRPTGQVIVHSYYRRQTVKKPVRVYILNVNW